MKIIFYFVSLVPKSFFVVLVDIFLFLRFYKYLPSYKVTLENIKMAYPNRNKSDAELLSKLSIRESFISGFESIYTWGRSEHDVNSKILRIENNFLVNRIKEKVDRPVKLIDNLDIDGDFVESQAFAYLAIRSYLGLPISFPQTTGVKKPCIGGKLIKNF